MKAEHYATLMIEVAQLGPIYDDPNAIVWDKYQAATGPSPFKSPLPAVTRPPHRSVANYRTT